MNEGLSAASGWNLYLFKAADVTLDVRAHLQATLLQ